MSQITKNVVNDGDTFTVDVEVKGDQNFPCYNAQLEFQLPLGVSLIGPLQNPGSSLIDVPKGVYQLSTDTWFLGDLVAAEVVQGPFEFRVDDVSQADPNDGRIMIPLVLTTSCNEADTSDNILTIVVQVGAGAASCNDIEIVS